MGLLSGRLARDSGHIVISDRKLYFSARASELSLDVRAVISHAVSPIIDCVLEMWACIECGQANDLERMRITGAVPTAWRLRHRHQ